MERLHRTVFQLTFVTIFSLNLFDLRLILSKISGGKWLEINGGGYKYWKLYHLMFTDIYSKYVLFFLGVIGIHLVNSGPDMLLLLLKAPTNNWAPSSPTRLTSWALSSSTDFSLTISCLSTVLKPALSRKSRSVTSHRCLTLCLQVN